ncbi:hypothetical protein VTI74DRAFT_8918 [Chaetomium olivicolor]
MLIFAAPSRTVSVLCRYLSFGPSNMHHRLLSVLAASAVVGVNAATTASPYDYIVVGSGPGGGPLAAELDRAGFSTLLIEAGGDEGDNPTFADIGNFNEAANDEATRWDFWVKHSDDPARDLKFTHNTWDTGDGTFYYPRAAVLGGCGMHNAGVCALPADDDWDIIAKKTGDKSWSADNMRKYLKKIEKNEYLPAGNAAHGYDGWLSTSVANNSWAKNDSLPDTKILQKLAELTGQDPDNAANLVNRDLLESGKKADDTSSFYNMVTHADAKGKRSSPNNYIRATLADPVKYPLTVKLHTLVTRVLFDNTTTLSKPSVAPRAIGVEIMEGASLYRADPKYAPGAKCPISQILANREVIISGGAFNSPQILKLSGIGPAAELTKFSIPVVKDLLGVGENLGDNYEGSILARGSAPVESRLITLLLRTPSAPTRKLNIYAWCGAFSFEGFWPGFPTYYGPTQYSCAMVHMAPKSQAGSVRLASADPQDWPEINFRFFARHGEQDLREIVEAADILREAINAAGPPVAPLEERHPCPGGKAAANCTDAAQAEFFKLQAYSHHAMSTCAIGGDGDRMAVLDSRFRVRGAAEDIIAEAKKLPR